MFNFKDGEMILETYNHGYKSPDLKPPEVQDEVTMLEVVTIFIGRWKYLVSLALVFVLIALVKHKYFPIYPSTGKLIIKDQSDGQIQSFLKNIPSSFGGLSVQNSSDQVNKAIIFLETNDFFISLADKIIETVQLNQTETPDFQAFKILLSQIKTPQTDPEFRQSLATKLDGMISFSPSKTGQIIFKVKSNNKSISVFLVNSSLAQAKDVLIAHEMNELNRAELYFQSEVEKVKKRLDELEGETVFKLREKDTISVDAKTDETSRYLNELRKNINDNKIKISENNMLLSTLRKKLKKGPHAEANALSKFDLSNKILMIEDENKGYRIRLKTYESYLKKYGGQSQKLVPFQNEIEKIKNNYIFESKVYENLRDSLARIGLQKTFVLYSVEILEQERLSRVKSEPGLIMMILIALMLSQIIGFGGIYLLELFKPLRKPKNPLYYKI